MPWQEGKCLAAFQDAVAALKHLTLGQTFTRLRHYANNELNLDEFLFFESAAEIPDALPLPETPFSGASVVPWRYNLNTGTYISLLHLHQYNTG